MELNDVLGVTEGLYLAPRKFPEWGFFLTLVLQHQVGRNHKEWLPGAQVYLEHLYTSSVLRSFQPLWNHSELSSSGEMDIKYLFLKFMQEGTDDSYENNP